MQPPISSNEKWGVMDKNIRKVLIIDDEKDICVLLSGILKILGMKATFSTSLTEGIQRITNENFELVFLDINLPDGSGIETLPRIKTLNPELNVIMISAYDGENERRQAREKGALDFISKPLSTKKIKEKLKYHFTGLNL